VRTRGHVGGLEFERRGVLELIEWVHGVRLDCIAGECLCIKT